MCLSRAGHCGITGGSFHSPLTESMPERSTLHPALLPEGLYDLLPPHAQQERLLTGALISHFERFGYDQVSPPLMEYENALLAGRGESLAAQTFRVMDPQSAAMLAFRPDMTMQVGRIAHYRMRHVVRPLRLSYAGSTLRVRGEPSDRSRQQRQVGLELIGASSAEADAEVMAVAVLALQAAGVPDLTLDLYLPGLLAMILQEASVDESAYGAVRNALECKDPMALEGLGLSSAVVKCLEELLSASDVAGVALKRLQALALPHDAKAQLEHVAAVVALLEHKQLPARLMIDPSEQRGFEYHHVLSYSLFTSAGGGVEIGRGGRYVAHVADANDGAEQGTGATLYVNALLRILAPQGASPRVLVPASLEWGVIAQLHQQGKVVVRAIATKCTPEAAKAHGCAWIYQGNQCVPVAE